MVAQIARHFNLPDSKATSSNLQADLFQQFIYLTQVYPPVRKKAEHTQCLVSSMGVPFLTWRIHCSL